jgi:hypothetical protein
MIMVDFSATGIDVPILRVGLVYTWGVHDEQQQKLCNPGQPQNACSSIQSKSAYSQ